MVVKKSEADAKCEDFNKEKLDLDRILEEEIGTLGKFQVYNLFLLSISILFSGLGNEYVFSTGRINTRCVIPECDTTNPDFRPEWVLFAIPGDESSLDDCRRYSPSLTANGSTTCSEEGFDRTSLIECDSYVYETQNTVVYDFGLACQEWKRSLIGTLRTAGNLLALPVTGYISDRWGRRTALFVNLLNSAWIGTARYWINSFEVFLVFQVMEAIFAGGILASAFILETEIVGKNLRTYAGANGHSFFALGQMSLGLIAWATVDWRQMTLSLYVPQFVAVLYIWLISESVRWYLSKGKYDKAEKTLLRIAKENGRTLSQKSINQLQQMSKVEEKEETTEKVWLLPLVFKHKPVLLRCLICPIWWITMTFVYYGLALNAVNLTGNSYLNYSVVALVDIPGLWLASYLMNFLGRKPVLIAGYWVCSVCQIGFIFLNEVSFGLSLFLYLLSKLSIAFVALTIYSYTSELYPTQYRNRLFAYSSMIGRIGSILAPLTPALSSEIWEPLPFVLFAAMAMISGLSVFLTPETKGIKLPDTMEEASNIGKTKSAF